MDEMSDNAFWACEFEEPRVPTLLEAAEELKGLWDKSISSCQSVKLETWNDAIDRLSDAIEREKCKPVRNHDNGNAADRAIMNVEPSSGAMLSVRKEARTEE